MKTIVSVGQHSACQNLNAPQPSSQG